MLLAADLGLAAQLLLAPLSPLLPAAAWLLMALPMADLAGRASARTAQTLLVVGSGYLLAVLMVWPVWVLPATEQLGESPGDGRWSGWAWRCCCAGGDPAATLP